MSMSALDTGYAEPLEVVVAGGGVAGLEATLALNAHAGRRVRTRVVSPNTHFSDPSLTVAVPFGLAEPRRFSVSEVVATHNAFHVTDTIARVDPQRHVAITGSGNELHYDALVLATGALRRPALPGAFTFAGPDAPAGFKRILAALVAGEATRVAFVVPAGVPWGLPAYELALLTATHLAARGVRGVELSLVTAEHTPLGVFGPRASDRVGLLLREAGVCLRAVAPDRLEGGALLLPGGDRLAVDHVVALPRLEAPVIEGVPMTPSGFVPVDRHGRVEGLDDVFAAGDATSYPINQGGVAAQQADAVAETIAEQAGAPITARAFRPVLRGAMLSGQGVEYMRRLPNQPDASPSRDALWWPATKIAARYLGPVLAGADAEHETRTLEDVGPWHAAAERGALAMALEAADADAGWGDYSAALRWLSVAEQLGVVLPEEYAVKREWWRDAIVGLPVPAPA